MRKQAGETFGNLPKTRTYFVMEGYARSLQISVTSCPCAQHRSCYRRIHRDRLPADCQPIKLMLVRHRGGPKSVPARSDPELTC